RLAGTAKQYSTPASSQLTRITHHSVRAFAAAGPPCRCQYHAVVMNRFESVSRISVGIAPLWPTPAPSRKPEGTRRTEPATLLARLPGMPSTVIRRFAYRPREGWLDIEFVSGSVYRYFAVPGGVASELAESRTKGVYFGRAIRN